jgi:hypothetical protein
VLNNNLTTTNNETHYRRIQGLVGEKSFSIVLPKSYAVNLKIGKGDFVRVSQEGSKIIIEKA